MPSDCLNFYIKILVPLTESAFIDKGESTVLVVR
jgi:hypothetical protein